MKMKIFTAFVIMLLLSGCELNDPRPKVYPAQVLLINNNVCMSVPAEKGEFIVSLNIESQEKEKSLRKHFTDDSHPVYISPEQCIPFYGYQFEADSPYGLSIQLEKKEGQMKGVAGRVFATSFVLVRGENKQLTLKAIN